MKSLGINDQVLVIGCISKIIRLTDQAKQNKYKGYHLDISSIQMEQMITLSLKKYLEKNLKTNKKSITGFHATLI